MSLRTVRCEHVRAQYLTGNAGDALDSYDTFSRNAPPLINCAMGDAQRSGQVQFDDAVLGE